MQMKKYKLGEIAEINASSIKSSDKIDEILYLDTANITENRIDTLQRFGLKKAPSRAQRKVKDNTIIFSTVRPNQSHFGIMKNPASNLIVSSGFATLDIKNPDEFNADYLYYNLTQPFIVNYLQTVAQNQVSSYPSINPSDLANLNLSFPPFSEQKKIASVLSSIDEKIALNRRINAKLEQLAKRLYDYWFVQFDFPNENGKPYKSSGGKMAYNAELKREIPAVWEVKNIFDAADVIYGFPYATEPFDEDIENSRNPYSVIRIRDILENTISAKTTEKSGEKYKTQVGDLLIGMDGYFHMNFWSRNDDYVNQRITRIRKTCISTLILYHQILPFIKFKEKKAKGSTVGHLSDKDIKQIEILIPDNKNLSDKFDLILYLMMKNRQENVKLSRMRDSLLPLLMNGQVEII